MLSMTNIELVTNIMEFSEYGSMSQLVVMEAIESYVRNIESRGVDALVEAWGEDFLINPRRWFRTCVEIREKLDARRE